ncbi:MAG: hypothetical protein IT324_07630 [Anaerolineae bacterium]|nr:hypothetical protein [Anaerolineae bacterium]
MTLRQRRLRVTFASLLPILALLLIYMFVRMHNLLALPPFLDEFHHIEWANDTLTGHPLIAAPNGKLFGVWWLALFQPYGSGVIWVVRAATIIFSLLGVAAVYSTGRRLSLPHPPTPSPQAARGSAASGFASPPRPSPLHGEGSRSRPILTLDGGTEGEANFVGMFAALLYILAPYLAWHERMALVDGYTATFGVLALWFSVRLVITRQDRDALLAGLMLAAAIAAKATGLMLFVIPALAVIFLTPRWNWLTRLRNLVITYGVLLIIWGPFYLFLNSRGWHFFGVATNVVGTSSVKGLPARLLENLIGAIQSDWVYFNGLLVLGGALALYLLIRRWRLGAFLILSTLLPLAGLGAFAGEILPRYMLLHVPLLIVLLSVGLGVLSDDLGRRWPAVPFALRAVMVVWIVLLGLPFTVQLWNDPSAVSLPPVDRQQYVTSDASGYAIDQAAGYLLQQAKDQGSLHVVSLLANCQGLRLYLAQNRQITLDCPYLTFDGSNQRALDTLINQRAAEGLNLWIAEEGLPYAKLEGITVPYDRIAVFPRPDNVTRVTLYRVQAK